MKVSITLFSIAFSAIFLLGSQAHALQPQEQKFLQLINRFRHELHLQPLAIDARLQASAFKHTVWMDDQETLTHYGPTPITSSGDRMIAEGSPCTLCGENIAFGNTDPTRTFLQWVFSTSHLLGMMTPRYDHIGISNVGLYWTTDFAEMNQRSYQEEESEHTPTQPEVVRAVEAVVGPLGESVSEISLIEEPKTPKLLRRLLPKKADVQKSDQNSDADDEDEIDDDEADGDESPVNVHQILNKVHNWFHQRGL